MPKLLERWEVMPHGELNEIDDGILTVAGTIKMPLGNFPRRMTVVRLASGGTAIWSAIALDEPRWRGSRRWACPTFLIVPERQPPARRQNLEAALSRVKVRDPARRARRGRGSRCRSMPPSDVLGDPAVRVPDDARHGRARRRADDCARPRHDAGGQRPDRQSPSSRRGHAAYHGAADGVWRVGARKYRAYPAQAASTTRRRWHGNFATGRRSAISSGSSCRTATRSRTIRPACSPTWRSHSASRS